MTGVELGLDGLKETDPGSRVRQGSASHDCRQMSSNGEALNAITLGRHNN